MITKDASIRWNPAELEKVVRYRIRMFTFARANYRAERAIEYLLGNRAEIVRLLREEPAPFIGVLSGEGLRLIPLGRGAA